MKYLLFIPFIVAYFSFYVLQAGGSDSIPDLKVSALTHPVTLNQFTLAAVDSSRSSGFKSLPSSFFKNDTSDYFANYIPVADTRYPFYFSFNIINDSPDTASFFVYVEPEQSIRLCSTTAQGIVVDSIPIQHNDSFVVEQRFFTISLSPKQQQRYVIRIDFPQRRFSILNFWIGPIEQFESFAWFHFGLDSSGTLADFIFFGMILMMLVYMISKYVQIRKLEYLYYAAYTFFFVSFFLLKIIESIDTPFYFTTPALHSLAYIELQLLAYWMYYLFIQQYLNMKVVFPRAHRLINIIILFIIGYIVLELVMHFIPEMLMLRWQFWDIARISLAVTGLALTISFAFIGNKLSYYLVAGGSALAFFGMLSMLFSLYPEWIVDWPSFLSNGLSYFEIGILIELLFFALGLGHKNKMDEIEKVEAKEALKHAEERQHIKHLRVLSEVQEQERSRFARDLHDGLGGMLWGIKLSLSNIKGNMVLTGDQVPVFERSLDMLDNSITELRRVAHNLMPEALVKFGLSAALKDFCDFINDSKVISVTYQKVGDEKRLDISVEVVLYRIINELVNNALRHSSASELLIQLNYDDSFLMLTVEDNGTGFDKEILNNTTGSGWPNIKSRIEYLKGSLDVETGLGNGTSVSITIPV